MNFMKIIAVSSLKQQTNYTAELEKKNCIAP